MEFLLRMRICDFCCGANGGKKLEDIHTDRSQRDGFREAAYREYEQLLDGQLPGLLFFDHLLGVL